MKNVAKESKKFELVSEMSGNMQRNYSLFDNEIVFRNVRQNSSADNERMFLEILKQRVDDLVSVASSSDAVSDVNHSYEEMKKLVEHQIINKEFDENFDYLNYFQLNDDFMELPSQSYEMVETEQLDREKAFVPEEYESQYDGVWWF